MNLLNSIVPQYYNYLPLAVIVVFECIVIVVEIMALDILWRNKFIRNTLIKEDLGLKVGVIAVIIGNLVTFIIGIVIYVLIGGSL